MTYLHTLKAEVIFTLRTRNLRIWILVVFFLSASSVYFGLAEVKEQHLMIERLIQADQQDRAATAKKLEDWGSAAYYNFHLTYDPPSEFAFAAIGQRDLQPWKHRIRMLALEGQIYERDVGNPVIALIGRFDFAFFAAFVFPLILIILLYDLRVSERIAGRYELLEATVGNAFLFWLTRASLKVSCLFVSLIVPLAVAALYKGVAVTTLFIVILSLLLYTGFWILLCYISGACRKSGSLILLSLIGVWIAMAVIFPAGFKLAIDRAVPVPSGAEILMTQRETVNDAWDLPREVTMDAFFKRHPQWSDYKPVKISFEWPWYYAFQQVGDQRTEPLTQAYRKARLKRDNMAGWASLFAPPSLLERLLQFLAHTDMKAAIAYEDKVRDYHAELRDFYYPRFFRHVDFDKLELKNLPQFNLED